MHLYTAACCMSVVANQQHVLQVIPETCVAGSRSGREWKLGQYAGRED